MDARVCEAVAAAQNYIRGATRLKRCFNYAKMRAVAKALYHDDSATLYDPASRTTLMTWHGLRGACSAARDRSQRGRAQAVQGASHARARDTPPFRVGRFITIKTADR